jgi:hypothetical protein
MQRQQQQQQQHHHHHHHYHLKALASKSNKCIQTMIYLGACSYLGCFILDVQVHAAHFHLH